MIFRGATIPLKMVRLSIVRHVTAAESVKVPHIGEVIVDAYVDRHENQEGKEEDRLLVEICPSLPERYGCILAPLMANAAISITVAVHVFNPRGYLAVIRQDTMVGQVEPVEVVSTILGCKNPKKRDNFSVARRVLLTERSPLPNKASRVTEAGDLICPEDSGALGSTP